MRFQFAKDVVGDVINLDILFKNCQWSKQDFKDFGCGKMDLTKWTCPQCKSKEGKSFSNSLIYKNRSNRMDIVANNFELVDYCPGITHNSPGSSKHSHEWQ